MNIKIIAAICFGATLGARYPDASPGSWPLFDLAGIWTESADPLSPKKAELEENATAPASNPKEIIDVDWAHIIINPEKYDNKRIRIYGQLRLRIKFDDVIECEIVDFESGRTGSPWRALQLLNGYEFHRFLEENGATSLSEIQRLDGMPCEVVGQFGKHDPGQLDIAKIEKLDTLSFSMPVVQHFRGDLKK